MSDQPPDADSELLTQSDLESFAAKVQEWGVSLPPKEQAILTLLLAQGQDLSDAQGFFYGGVFQNLAIARFNATLTQGTIAGNFASRAYLGNNSGGQGRG